MKNILAVVKSKNRNKGSREDSEVAGFFVISHIRIKVYFS